MKPTFEPLRPSSVNERIQELFVKNGAPGEMDDVLARANRIFRDNDLSVDRTRQHLLPHSFEYISKLCPIFLNQLRQRDVVDCFPHALSRDGLLSLSYFFHKVAPPENGSGSLIFVNRRFAPLVPEPWRGHIAYYSVGPRPNQAVVSSDQDRDVYLILTAIDERQCSFQYLKNRLTFLQESLGERLLKARIHVLSVFSITTTMDIRSSDRKMQYYFKCLMEIRERLGPDLKCVTWEELQSRPLRGSQFMDLNEFDFYYSDSFITHTFLGHGAIPFGCSKYQPADWDYWVDASLAHGYGIYLRGSAAPAEFEKVISDEMRFLKTDLYIEEEREFEAMPQGSFRDQLKFCPLSFETLLYSLAQKTLTG